MRARSAPRVERGNSPVTGGKGSRRQIARRFCTVSRWLQWLSAPAVLQPCRRLKAGLLLECSPVYTQGRLALALASAQGVTRYWKGRRNIWEPVGCQIGTGLGVSPSCCGWGWLITPKRPRAVHGIHPMLPQGPAIRRFGLSKGITLDRLARANRVSRHKADQYRPLWCASPKARRRTLGGASHFDQRWPTWDNSPADQRRRFSRGVKKTSPV